MPKKRRAKTIGVLEFTRIFPDEDAAVQHVESVLWGGATICPRCSHDDRIRDGQKPYQRWCGRCRKYFSVKVGTVMEASNLPVRVWLLAMYYLVTARKGISSLQLSKELSITQKSCWHLLHRIREACGDKLEALSDIVEVDETFIGGKAKNRHARVRAKVKRRGFVGKQAIFGMRQRDGATIAAPVPGTDTGTLVPAIQQVVQPGTIVFSDDHGAYRHLQQLGYRHKALNHSAGEYVHGPAHTNSIESVWAVLKRGYHGTYHQWSTKHMRRYVDEFTFRLNAGDVQYDTIDRIASLSRAMVGKRLRYRELTANA